MYDSGAGTACVNAECTDGIWCREHKQDPAVWAAYVNSTLINPDCTCVACSYYRTLY